MFACGNVAELRITKTEVADIADVAGARRRTLVDKSK